MCIKTILVGLFFLTTFNFAAQTVEQQNFINDLDIFVEKKKKDFSSFELNFLQTIEDIELTQDHLTWRAEHLKNYLEESKDNLTDEEITDFEIKFENYRELLKLCKEKTRSVYLNKKRR